MSRLALCLFFIAIFHYGILKAHAEETTTESLSKTNEEVEVAAKPVEVEKVKVEDDVALKLEPQAKSAEPVKEEPKKNADTVIHTIAATPIKDASNKDGNNEEKDATNKDGNIENTFLMPPMQIFKSIPMKHTQVFFELPGNALEQSTQALNVVGGQIGAAVANTINTAKYLATAPFGLLRSAVNSALDHE